MGFEVLAYAGRTQAFAGSLYQADGSTPVVLNLSDRLRFKLSGYGVLLDLEDGVPSAGGSLLTVTTRGAAGPTPAAATYSVKLHQGDTAAWPQGAYAAEVIVVDAGDANLAKQAEGRGVVHVLPAAGGPVGP